MIKRLRGPAGSRVTTNHRRNDRSPFEVGLMRDVIRVVSVKSDLKSNGIGYARVADVRPEHPVRIGGRDHPNEGPGAGPPERLHSRFAQRPRRFARRRDRRLRRLSRRRVVVVTRGRNTADDHLYRAPVARRPAARHAGCRADQQRLGIGSGNRRRRVARSPASHGDGPELWQGLL